MAPALAAVTIVTCCLAPSPSRGARASKYQVFDTSSSHRETAMQRALFDGHGRLSSRRSRASSAPAACCCGPRTATTGKSKMVRTASCSAVPRGAQGNECPTEYTNATLKKASYCPWVKLKFTSRSWNRTDAPGRRAQPMTCGTVRRRHQINSPAVADNAVQSRISSARRPYPTYVVSTPLTHALHRACSVSSSRLPLSSSSTSGDRNLDDLVNVDVLYLCVQKKGPATCAMQNYRGRAAECKKIAV